jgi:hypothetical protein
MTQEDIIRVMKELIGPESEGWSVNEALLEEWLPFLQAIAAAGAAAEREAISDEYAARLQGDLENGVRRLNEAAASEFHKKYPQLAGFNAWLNEREKDD